MSVKDDHLRENEKKPNNFDCLDYIVHVYLQKKWFVIRVLALHNWTGILDCIRYIIIIVMSVFLERLSM